MSNKITAGFIGAGGIAKSHVFALNSIRYYYNDSPRIDLVAVSSSTGKSRETFASKYGFRKAVTPEDFFADQEIDTVYILGPNKVHFEHIQRAVRMPSVRRVYIEKPLCSELEEERLIAELAAKNPQIMFQLGFQYVFMTTVREALSIWRSGKFGTPLHFDFKYYHGDYLRKSYRDKRANRLTPAPDGGAMADLGSHAVSLMIAFLGNDLVVDDALKAGRFADVDPRSDLYSVITIVDRKTGAAGTVSSSRIASGSGDMLSMELYAEKGAIRLSSHEPDILHTYLEETGTWSRLQCGSNYKDISSFPSAHVPPGWLRPMIHAHYVFLTGYKQEAIIPDIEHGLQVQRIVRETAQILNSKTG